MRVSSDGFDGARRRGYPILANPAAAGWTLDVFDVVVRRGLVETAE
jgi:hypothetical protein